MTAAARPVAGMVAGVVAGVAVALLLVGCSQVYDAGAPVADRASTDGAGAGPAAATEEPARSLPSCPATDRAVAARPGGLPDVTVPCLGAGGSGMTGSGAAGVRLAGLRGTPLVVNVWGSWCVPCREEMPALAEVATAAAGTVGFLGVDVAEDAATGSAFAATMRLPYPSVVDGAGAAKPGLGYARGVPTTLFVRADGSVAGVTYGPVGDAAALRARIAGTLGVVVP